MDQIRVAIAWLKEQHFWVLSALVVLVGMASWYVASGDLAKQFQDNQQVINAKFEATKSLESRPFHPNLTINDNQERENSELASEVGQLWSTLYQRQREEALIWPKNLGSRFVKEMADKQFGDHIPDLLCQTYLDYAQNRFAALPKIVDARELSEGRGAGVLQGGGGMGGELGGGFGGGMPGGFGASFGGSRGGFLGMNPRGAGDDEVDEEHPVRWHDQLNIKQQLAWSKRPKPLRIWVTQEDLWVYETLLRAIAATNRAVMEESNSSAPIQDIWALQVGQPAVDRQRTESRIFRPESESSGRGRMGGEGSPMGMAKMEGGDEGMPMSMPGGGDQALDEASQLLAGRYLDENGAPLPAPSGDDYSFGREYKRLPVRLALKMDQRRLARLIVDLANAPLPIEVKEVRINPSGDLSGGGMGGGQSRPSGFTGGTSPGVSDTSQVHAFNRNPNINDVILQGAVYLFNPPDSSLLATESESDQVADLY